RSICSASIGPPSEARLRGASGPAARRSSRRSPPRWRYVAPGRTSWHAGPLAARARARSERARGVASACAAAASRASCASGVAPGPAPGAEHLLRQEARLVVHRARAGDVVAEVVGRPAGAPAAIDLPQRREDPEAAPRLVGVEERIDAREAVRTGVEDADGDQAGSEAIAGLQRREGALEEEGLEVRAGARHRVAVARVEVADEEPVRLGGRHRGSELDAQVGVAAPDAALRAARAELRGEHAPLPAPGAGRAGRAVAGLAGAGEVRREQALVVGAAEPARRVDLVSGGAAREVRAGSLRPEGHAPLRAAGA